MIGKFVRVASLGFSLVSAFYWMTVASFVQILSFVETQTEVATGARWAAQSVPIIVYGVACAFFCHWFAKGIVRRIDVKGPFE